VYCCRLCYNYNDDNSRQRTITIQQLLVSTHTYYDYNEISCILHRRYYRLWSNIVRQQQQQQNDIERSMSMVRWDVLLVQSMLCRSYLLCIKDRRISSSGRYCSYFCDGAYSTNTTITTTTIATTSISTINRKRDTTITNTTWSHHQLFVHLLFFSYIYFEIR